ncbi:MAG: hypothetical protein Q8L27_00005 [archaeon]|nr:hypothetical protein [archaeon]
MKNINKIIISCILLIALISCLSYVYADETDVIVTGMKGYVFNLTVNMVKADGGDLIQAQENDTQASDGIGRFRFTSASQKVSFYIVARTNGKILTTKKPIEIGNYSTGAYVYINLFDTTPSSTTTAVVTETPIEEPVPEDTAETADPESSTIINLETKLTTTAAGIYGDIKSGLTVAFPWILWGLLGLVVLVGVFFGGWWIIKWNKKRYISGTKNYEDLVSSGDDERPIAQKKIAIKKPQSNSSFENDLEKAEQKIKEAQEEINRIKNRKNRLTEAQKKYEAAKEELELLQDEE